MNKENAMTSSTAAEAGPTIQLQQQKPGCSNSNGTQQQKNSSNSTSPTTKMKRRQASGTNKPKPRRQFAMNTKLVPFTEVEWKYVQKAFMSDDLRDLEQMVDLMSMWICRMQHETPVIIGISELVLRALMMDRKHQNAGQTGMDSADVGLIYGSVIIRFVNYVNEICQPDGGKPMMSIANAVSRMNIPSWIVTIRHEATHGQMPPMNLMKEAVKFCRRWLWKKHWSRPFNDAIREPDPREAVEQRREEQKSTTGHKIVNALNRFREWRRKFRSLDQFHTVDAHPFQDKARVQIEQLLESSPDEFIQFFTLSCLSRSAPNQSNNNDSGIFDADSDGLMMVMEDDDDEAEEGEVEAIPVLEGDVMSLTKYIDTVDGLEQQYYRPVLELIQIKGCLQRLLIELTRMVAYPPPSDQFDFAHRRHLAGWADLLLSAYIQMAESVSMQHWRLVLKHVVMSPQFFRDENIISVLDVLNDSITDRCRQRLINLLKIRHLVAPMVNGDEQQQHSPSAHSLLETSLISVRSIADLQRRIIAEEQADLNCTFQRDPLTLEDAWSLAQPDELGPLGLTSNQRADTLCLALGCDNFFV